MATKFIYSDQTGPTLPGGKPLFFRTYTRYEIDSSGKVVNPITYVYYTGVPGGRAKNGDTWVPGNANTGEGFNPGGFSLAAITRDGGKTFTTFPYGPNDTIPSGKKVGDPILGEQALRSLNTRGGVINEGIQKSIINTADQTQPGLAKQLAAKLQNAAPTPPQRPQVGGNPTPQNPPTENQPPAGESPPNGSTSTPVDPFGKIEESKNQITIIGVGNPLKYPEKLNRNLQDTIRFTAVRLESRSGQSKGTGSGFDFSFGVPVFKPVDGDVYLPIQSPISDQNSVEWGPDSVNAIDAALYNTSVSAVKSGIEGISTEIEKFWENIYKTSNENSDKFQRWLSGKAASVNNILPRTDNIILNPNLELLFQGPQLRPFTFTFKLSARESIEAEKIKKIINYFKYHMAVRKDNGLFLKAPNVFRIDYFYKTQLHPGINRISNNENTKACALLNFSVDYTPLGSYMTYSEGTMVSYTLNMQFQELIPIYDTDYNGIINSTPENIGF